MMLGEARLRLEKAPNEGDEETVQSICMGGLGALAADVNAKVCIAGEDHNEH